MGEYSYEYSYDSVDDEGPVAVVPTGFARSSSGAGTIQKKKTTGGSKLSEKQLANLSKGRDKNAEVAREAKATREIKKAEVEADKLRKYEEEVERRFIRAQVVKEEKEAKATSEARSSSYGGRESKVVKPQPVKTATRRRKPPVVVEEYSYVSDSDTPPPPKIFKKSKPPTVGRGQPPKAPPLSHKDRMRLLGF
jgi:hypothetical protein